MTEPAGVTVEMRSRSRLVEPERILPDYVVDAKSALRPEVLKPTFTGFRVVARLGLLPRASCATANRASRPLRRFKPPVDLAKALRRAALSSSGRTAASAACRILPRSPSHAGADGDMNVSSGSNLAVRSWFRERPVSAPCPLCSATPRSTGLPHTYGPAAVRK
jgi:hypothetical protein